MVKRKIIWLRLAELDMLDIMLYYIKKNKSKVYSSRLFREVNFKLNTFDFTIALPQKTSIPDLYYFNHNHIVVFFVFEMNTITVKFVTDGRRNPKGIQSLID
jgi:toxin YoeB